jgi:hypothetical protein
MPTLTSPSVAHRPVKVEDNLYTQKKVPGQVQHEGIEDYFRNLSKFELIAMIKGYRKSDAGLEDLDKTELILLFQSYRSAGRSGPALKRERNHNSKNEDDEEIEIVEIRTKRRRAGPDDEVIVLD